MSHRRTGRTVRRPSPRLAVALAALACAGLAPSAAQAKGCSEGSPSAQPPQSLWGALRPVKTITDSTIYTGKQRSDGNLPINTYLDIENGYIFVSWFSGFSIWDARGAKATNPELLSKMDGWQGAFGTWVPPGEFKDMIFGLDAPAGDDTVLAVSGYAPVGFSIWDTTNKGAPRQVYQDHTYRYSMQVYAANIGGRNYAFVADPAGTPGLHLYDMTAAKAKSTRCLENTGVGETSCGVYLGKIANRAVKYVAGTQVGGRTYVATSSVTFNPRGVEVWDVTTPTSPRLVKADLTSTIVHGVAMWAENGTAYLAARTEGTSEQALFFALSGCGATSGCSGMQQVASRPLPSSGSSFDWRSATFSRSNNTPFVHFGDNMLCANGVSNLRHESLFDVTTVSNPQEISPTATIAHPADPTLQVDYWGWYYSTFTKGYSHVAPRAGKFSGNIFYRAASSLFDAHEWTAGPGQPPVANFSWSPTQIYPGDQVDFTDLSTGGVTSRSWAFQDATPSTSAATHPQDVVFHSPGQKQVSLQAIGGAGTDGETKMVTVIDPSPAIGGITKDVPGTPLICQPINFTATNVTGKPPLSYAWQVRDAQQQVVHSGSSTSLLWTDPAPGTAGNFTVHLTVSGSGTPATATPFPVSRNPLPDLVTPFAPTNSPFSHGTVQFHVNQPGATEWRWDFGDGTGWTAWTSDPVAGPNPVHVYTAKGDYHVEVEVRNCLAGPVKSEQLLVEVLEVEPLEIVQFQAQDCPLAPCTYTVGTTVTFAQQVKGDPTTFKYDWDGDGTYEQTSATMVPTHTYSQVKTVAFKPRMRIERGTEPAVEFTHQAGLSIGSNAPPQPPASIGISGPASGGIGQSMSFTASASGCTPSANWSWTATNGGTVNGSGSSVSISWSSSGGKTVRVTNSGCGSVQGQKSVTINGSSSGLTADFSFSPTAPKPGQSVAFNGGSSSGSPTSYQWTFGDGATATTTGPATSHTYANPGSYLVKLTVEKAATGGGCDLGVCLPETHSVTKTVVVEGVSNELAAKFAHTPTAPSSGTPVLFDATTSTGSPTLYRWKFGDGTSATADGPTVHHTYSKAGTYSVELTVEKPASTGAGCDFGICLPQTSTLTKQVVVIAGVSANGCTGELEDDPDKLCLGEGRYIVEVDWENYHSPSGEVGEGLFRRLGGSESTGFFWFFNPDSIDLIVKIIDGSVVNEHVWVFYGALTDVIYDLKVTDTLTNQTRTYKNLAGSICGRGDTAAFSTAGLTAPATAPSSTAANLATVAAEAGTEEVLHLLDGRFKVKVGWENHHDPQLKKGSGRSVTGTDGSGYFWFFEPTSLDLVVKMIDAREFDGHFWVFYGGLSDVKYSLEIEDTVTGEIWQRTNPKGSICGGSDTAAFSALGG